MIGEVVGTTEAGGCPQDSGLFPQIEQALTGMEVGDEETVAAGGNLDHRRAAPFGPGRDELVIDIPREPAPRSNSPPRSRAWPCRPSRLTVRR